MVPFIIVVTDWLGKSINMTFLSNSPLRIIVASKLFSGLIRSNHCFNKIRLITGNVTKRF